MVVQDDGRGDESPDLIWSHFLVLGTRMRDGEGISTNLNISISNCRNTELQLRGVEMNELINQ